MEGNQLKKLLKDVAKGVITTETAQKQIEKVTAESRKKAQRLDTSGCRY